MWLRREVWGNYSESSRVYKNRNMKWKLKDTEDRMRRCSRWNNGKRVWEAIWRYNYWECSRIKGKHESSEENFKISTTWRKRSCKETKEKDFTYKRMTTRLIQTVYLITIDARRKCSNSCWILRKITIKNQYPGKKR